MVQFSWISNSWEILLQKYFFAEEGNGLKFVCVSEVQRTLNYLSGKLVYVLTIYLNLWNFLQWDSYCHRLALVKLNILSITKRCRNFSQRKIPETMSRALHLFVLGKRGGDIQECYLQDTAVCLISRQLKTFTKGFECLSSAYLSFWLFFENSIVCFKLLSLNNVFLLQKIYI